MNTKFIIAEVLNSGKNNSIPSQDLMALFHLKHKRELTKMIEKERRMGAPILSKKENSGGYYLAETDEEFNEFIKDQFGELYTRYDTIMLMIKFRYK